ncbi:CPBP family intramembrane metalloprotease [Mycoplasmatota bacterium]|nr:CPBP family intramembrane metalloprotease [Mycoplasmatota bacterium]
MKQSEIKSSHIVNILKSLLGFIGIYIVSEIIGEVCIIIILTCMGINIFSNDIPNNILTQTLPFFGFIVFTITTILYCKFIEKRSQQSIGFIKKGFIKNYLKGFVIGILLISIVILISLATGALTYEGVSENINILPILLFLFAYIIQGMAEEVMCRGYLMTSLSKKTSLFWAILLSSLAFTYPHLQSLFASEAQFGIIGLINTMLFSFLVSLFMVKGRNIWLVSAIHSSWNYVLGVVYGICVSGGETHPSIFNFSVNESKSLINGGMYGPEAGIITTIIMIFSLAILLLTIKKKNKITL